MIGLCAGVIECIISSIYSEKCLCHVFSANGKAAWVMSDGIQFTAAFIENVHAITK